MGGVFEGLLSSVLFVFNVFMGLAGLALIITAAVVAVEFRDYAQEELFESKYLWGPVGLAVGFGIVLLTLCIFGIGGLCGKKRKMIQMYLVFLGVFMGVEVAFVSSTFTTRAKIQESAEKGIRAAIPPAYNASNTKIAKAIDKLQEEFKCCGGTGARDYTNQTVAIPDSCCVSKTTGCAPAGPLHIQGCGKSLLDKYEDRSTGQLAVGITFLSLQALAIAFGWYRLSKECDNFV